MVIQLSKKRYTRDIMLNESQLKPLNQTVSPYKNKIFTSRYVLILTYNTFGKYNIQSMTIVLIKYN